MYKFVYVSKYNNNYYVPLQTRSGPPFRHHCRLAGCVWPVWLQTPAHRSKPAPLCWRRGSEKWGECGRGRGGRKRVERGGEGRERGGGERVT